MDTGEGQVMRFAFLGTVFGLLLFLAGCNTANSLATQIRWTGVGFDTEKDAAVAGSYVVSCAYNEENEAKLEQLKIEALQRGFHALQGDGFDLVTWVGPSDATLSVSTKFRDNPNVALGKAYRGFKFVVRGYKSSAGNAPADARPIAMALAAPNAGQASTTSTAVAAMPAARFAWPVSGTAVPKFGEAGDPIKGSYLDIQTARGATVKAVDGGVVELARSNPSGADSFIFILHAGGYSVAYACVASMLVKPGDAVAKGQPVATVGVCTNSTTPALRLAVYRNKQKVDPLSLLPSQ
jgi:murein DD-endopeptidase MepM/ murein hydrolase activator NlpD